MKKILSKLKDQKGQSMVEFALVVMLFLVIFFAITQFGFAWYRLAVLKNAANTAARTYAVTAGNKQAAALKNATGIVGHSTGFSFYTSESGSIKVTVIEDYETVVPGILPMLSNITLSRDATYRLE